MKSQIGEETGTRRKNTLAGTGMASILVSAWMLSVAATAQAGDDSCSAVRAAGTYAISDSGTVIGIGPRAAVALLTLDAAGNIKGPFTASLNGAVSTGTLSGTYTVDPDCRGAITFDEYDPAGNLQITATVAAVWDDHMRELHFVFTSAVRPDGAPLATVISCDARKKE